MKIGVALFMIISSLPQLLFASTLNASPWRRDPFVLPRSMRNSSQLSGVVVSNCPASMKLDAVLFDVQAPQVIINGDVLGKGAKHKGFRVVKIKENEVVLRSHRIECKLKLDI